MCCGFLKSIENIINNSFGWYAEHNLLNSVWFCVEYVYFRYLCVTPWDVSFLL